MSGPNVGTLTDKGMTDEGTMIARIDDRPFPVLPYVIPFLDKCERGSKVEFTTKDGKISKINRVKPGAVVDIACDAIEQAKQRMEKAGFGQPTGGNTTDCMSTKTPDATGLPKTLEGKISAIYPENNTFVLWREDF